MRFRLLGYGTLFWIAASTLPAQPLVEMNLAHRVYTRYFGDASAALTVAGGSAKPLSLASADFDEDGMPDLVSGFATADGAGLVSVHRGNVDALWPYGRAGTPPAFLPDARAIAVPEAPDFLGAGDFDADGHWDIVTAKLGSHALYLLRGDGHGGFAPAERIALPGAITAFTTGEIDRPDGLTDIAVGVSNDGGSQVLVFEWPGGALRGRPETLSVPSAVASLAMAALDDSGMNSLAVAAGNDLFIFHGRDRRLSQSKSVRDAVPPAAVTRQSFPFVLRALAAGRFTGSLLDLAVLGDDGKVHFLERPDAAYQAALASGPLAAPGIRGGPAHVRPGSNRPIALPPKPAAKELILAGEVALPSSSPIAARLVAARTSASEGDDLLAFDAASGQIHFLSRRARPERTMHLAASLAVPGGAPAVLLPMRLRPSAYQGLVLLNSGGTEPLVAEAGSPTVFTVTTTADSGPVNGSLYSTATPGSLRTAITNAANTSGATSIVFDIPATDSNYSASTGVFTIRPMPESNCNVTVGSAFLACQALPPLPAGCTIDGYTQPGASPNTLASGDNAVLKIQIDGSLDGQGPVGVNVSGGSSTVRGLILTGFTHVLDTGGNFEGGDGIDISSTANFVEGNFSGVDSTGVTVKANSSGIAEFGAGNVIGGTTPQARNLLSGNPFGNFTSASVATSGSELFQGNYSGADRTGKIAIGSGVAIAGQGTMVGGTTAGAGNLLSGGGSSSGLEISYVSPNSFTPDNNLVQGNFIGVDVTGAAPLPNSVGLSISAGNMNLAGGTTPAARNIISGNMGDGIDVSNAAGQNLIQGNYIGVDVSGASKVPNTGDGINHTGLNGAANAVGTTIGGETAGAGNVISANGLSGIELGGATSDVFGNKGSTVLGNLIGTDATGFVAMGNQGAGIHIDQGGSYFVIGNTDTPSVNTIAFNGGDGVLVDPANGNSYLGAIGLNSIANNPIYSNGGAGVRVASGTGNAVRENSIYSNAELGIDIDAAGVLTNSNCNSSNSGANNLQNAPVLTQATGATTLISATATDPNGNTSEFSNCVAMAFQGGSLDIEGSLNSYPNTTFQLDFFQNAACDVSGYGQGQTFLMSMAVTTNVSCAANISVPTNLSGAELSIVVGYPATETASTTIGALYTYAVMVTNLGAASAAGVVLSDPLPAGVTLASLSSTQGTCSAAGNNVTCNLGAMSSGTTATATIVVTVNAIGTIVNTATVASTTPDPIPGNNTSTLSIASDYQAAFIDHFTPGSAVAGTGALALTIFGSTFYQGVTTVTVNSQPLTYTLLHNQTCDGAPCQGLSVTIPGTLTASTGGLTLTVTNPAPGGGTYSSGFTVYANPGTVTHFLLSGIPNPCLQNTNYTLTVTALNAGNGTVTGYLGIVNLADSGYTSPTFTPPSPYQFTVGDNGVHAFTTNFSFAGADTITVTDAGTPSLAGSLSTLVNVLLGAPANINGNSAPDPMPIGFPFPALTVTVTDSSSNRLPGVTVTFTSPTSGASCTFPNGQTTYAAVTDSNGSASAVCTANQTAGQFQVDARVSALDAHWSLSNTTNVPAHLTIYAGNNQSSPLNTQFRLSPGVVVTDASNNRLEFIPVTFTAQTSSGATANLPAASGISERLADPVPGLGSVAPPFANGVAGSYTITASVGGLTAVFNETNTSTPNPVASVSVQSGSPQATAIGTPFPAALQATAADANGNLLANVPFTFTAPTSGASAALSASTANSGASTGTASVTATANGINGAYNVTVSAGGFSVRFALSNVGTVNTLTATFGTPQSTIVDTAFAAMLQATMLDPNGNPLSGQTVTFSAPGSGATANLSSQTAITNSAGIASVSATANGVAGSYTVTASAAASAGSSGVVTAAFALTNAPQTPASLMATGGTPQSAATGAGFANPLQVTVKDSNGNAINGVTVNFTAPASGPSATLSSGTAVTGATGIAAVTATANSVAGSYGVTAGVGLLHVSFALTNVVPPGKCDVNLDGVADVGDVQIMIGEALGSGAADNDLNGDGAVNVADIQMVIDAAMGGNCTAK